MIRVSDDLLLEVRFEDDRPLLRLISRSMRRDGAGGEVIIYGEEIKALIRALQEAGAALASRPHGGLRGWEAVVPCLPPVLHRAEAPGDQGAAEGVEMSAACRDFWEAFDLYLSDDLAGVDVRERYPSLWRHLQECPLCRREYEEWRELLARSRTGRLKAARSRGSLC